MSQPTELPEWGTGAGADNTEPSGSKKSQGFVDREKPVASTFNWLFNIIYAWITHFKSWSEGHDHRDDGTDGSAARISLEEEIDYTDVLPGYSGPANGYWKVQIDNTSEHRIKHQPNGATYTSYQDDIVMADEWFSLGSNDGTKLWDESGGVGNARVFTVEGTNGSDLAGVKSSAFRPITDEGGGDLLTEFPLNKSLYINNLCKAQAKAEFQWDTGESTWVGTIDSPNSYNVDASASGVSSGVYQFVLEDASYTPYNVQVSVTATQTRDYLAQVKGISQGVVNVKLTRFSGSGTSAFTSVFPSNNYDIAEIFDIQIVCF